MKNLMDSLHLSQQDIDSYVDENTKYINEHYNDLWYLEPLNKDKMKTFLHFGADKAGTKNMSLLLEENNLDPKIFSIRHPVLNYDVNNFISKDKKLIVTFMPSSCNNLKGEFYFHYLGVTGETELVISFIESFLKHGFYSELCFGGRDFV